jgi:hypothetical protein
MAKTRDLANPPDDVAHLDARLRAREVKRRVEAQQDRSRQIPAVEPDDIEERREQGKADQGRGDAGADQKPHRVDVHGLQRVDLLRHPHDADLRRHGGSGPGDHHDGREHRPHLAHEGERHGGAERGGGAVFHQCIIALQAEHQPGEGGGEADDEDGLHADEVDLLPDFIELERRLKDQHKPLLKEKKHPAQQPNEVQYFPAHGGDRRSQSDKCVHT